MKSQGGMKCRKRETCNQRRWKREYSVKKSTKKKRGRKGQSTDTDHKYRIGQCEIISCDVMQVIYCHFLLQLKYVSFVYVYVCTYVRMCVCLCADVCA